MDLYNLVLHNRSYRRFRQDVRISMEELAGFVNLARLSASARNMQALKYILINEAADCDKVFPSTLWAGYLNDWAGPAKGEQPSAYIIILEDIRLKDSFGVDHGIAAQSILLGATEKGYGGCMIGSVKREKLRKDLNIPDYLKILLIVALGKPAEKIIIDDVNDGDIRYWRDDQNIHHVPKRSLDELIVKL